MPAPKSNTKLRRILVFILIGITCRAFAADAAAWEKYRYSVVRVIDGDTFVATDGNVQFKVRIAGMDAPERKQAYGQSATAALSALLTGNAVTIKTVGNGTDSYGRVLGIVFVKERDVALELIRQGLATYYRPRCRDYPADKKSYNYDPRTYVEAETQARVSGVNFWSVSPVALPCRFRGR